MLGFWPLQSCMKTKVSDIPLLTEMLAAYPPAAKLVDEHGRRAVHYAASRNMDLTFVKALLETDPEGASAPDKNGQVPLHLAVKRGDLELMKLLISYHPRGVVDVDRYGMVALNYAVEGEVSLEIIALLLKTNKRSAENIISGHRTVLHQAVEFRRTTEVIQAIVAAYPEATKTHEGELGEHVPRDVCMGHN
jgi:ankyrin repeat protein